MARTDYYNDPDAPEPNALVPAATAIVVNHNSELLLERRRDNSLWALPGGGMKLGETLGQTIVREVREETGLEVEPAGLVGIYSDPRHVIAYDDGEVRQEFSVCFRTRLLGGQLVADAESTDLRWVAPDSLDSLPMHPTTRLRIEHYLAGEGLPFVH
jgi:8-oxo-dGTP pyrophosphatase MutT (NUDIX family)